MATVKPVAKALESAAPTSAPLVRVKAPATRLAKVAGKKPAAKRAARVAWRATVTKEKREALEIERMARRLEADWRAAVERHQQVVRKQFHELRTALHVRPGRKVPSYLKNVGKFRRDLDAKMKPKRGRAKDLKRVELALEKALARLPGK